MAPGREAAVSVRQMKLIPPEVFKQMVQSGAHQQDITTSADMRRAMDLDLEMRKVLESNVEDLDTKLQLHQQAFKRFLFLRNRLMQESESGGAAAAAVDAARAPAALAAAAAAAAVNPERKDDDNVQEEPRGVAYSPTVQHQPASDPGSAASTASPPTPALLPDKVKTKTARALLRRVSSIKGVSWSLGGDAIIDGERLLDTNIFDVVNALSSRGAEAKTLNINEGMRQLLKKLAENGVSKAHVANKDLWSNVFNGAVTTPTPPTRRRTTAGLSTRTEQRSAPGPVWRRGGGDNSKDTPKSSKPSTSKMRGHGGGRRHKTLTMRRKRLVWTSYRL